MATTNRIQPKRKTTSRESSPGLVTEVKRFLHLDGAGKISTLQGLFIEQLKDLYSAETQLIDALPKMAAAAHAPALKQGFTKHLAETKEHAKRLKEEPTGKTCKAMQGLVKEGSEAISEDASPAVKDAALIAAAQRVEHYEIAGYGCVKTYATLLKRNAAAKVLDLTLKEEGATDKKLTAAAKKLNVKALSPVKK